KRRARASPRLTRPENLQRLPKTKPCGETDASVACALAVPAWRFACRPAPSRISQARDRRGNIASTGADVIKARSIGFPVELQRAGRPGTCRVLQNGACQTWLD